MSHVLPVDTKVIAYFDAPSTPVFLLDDPVKGKLDDATYVLAGDIATDITADVTSVSVWRGRSRWLDSINAGTASFTVQNLTRDFDPFGGGTYSSDMVPGKRVTIEVGETPIFDGTVDDWDVAYTIGGYSTASAVVSDALSDLSRQTLTANTATSQLSGARVEAILNRAEVDFPAGSRNIDAGLETLQADTIDAGTNALDYLKLVTETESGRLFVTAEGVLTFQERSTPVPSADVLLFADNGTGIPFDHIEAALQPSNCDPERRAGANQRQRRLANSVRHPQHRRLRIVVQQRRRSSEPRRAARQQVRRSFAQVQPARCERRGVDDHSSHRSVDGRVG